MLPRLQKRDVHTYIFIDFLSHWQKTTNKIHTKIYLQFLQKITIILPIMSLFLMTQRPNIDTF